MKDAVVIKSFQKGITLMMDEEASFESILEEIAAKFSGAKNFFGNATTALSIEGKKLTNAEEIRIIDAIKRNSSLNILCIVGHDEETDKNYIKALRQVEKRLAKRDDAKFYKGSLDGEKVLETDSSIIILGDVHAGSAVISSKNIIILGGLYGEAYAGHNAYVVALEMAPKNLKIGGFKYKPNEKQKKWGKPKVQSKIAYVRNNRIIMEPLTKDLLDSFA